MVAELHDRRQSCDLGLHLQHVVLVDETARRRLRQYTLVHMLFCAWLWSPWPSWRYAWSLCSVGLGQENLWGRESRLSLTLTEH